MSTVEHKASLLDGLRKVCGYVENGTDDVVKIFQDDATKEWCVLCGEGKAVHAATFEKAIEAAITKWTTHFDNNNHSGRMR